MVYRVTSRSKEYANKRKARARRRVLGPSPDYPKEVPNLRKVIIVIDFDFGVVIKIMKLFKTTHIDQYRVVTNGVLWKERIGMSRILAGLRKAMPCVLSKRSL